MSTQELYAEPTNDSETDGKRIIEAEIKMPKLSDLHLPEVNLEPVRSVAEDVLVTTLGVGVLVTRGIVSAIKAAHQAGVEAAEAPDSWVHRFVNLMKPQKEGELIVRTNAKVPMMPVDDYDTLTVDEIAGRIETLNAEQLGVVRAYEAAHENRAVVIAALDARLA